MTDQYVNSDIDFDDEVLISHLRQGGFLIDDDHDEHDRLRLRMLSQRFSTTSLGLTIVPTADCNFRCPYCYEKDRIAQIYMTEEIQESIVKLLEKQVKHISHFSVTWFGGEPLMALDIIESLSKRFIEICEDNEVAYSAGMITNGYLLTRKTLELLKDLKVGFLQITIDGDRDTHNIMRPHVDGSGTFDKILKNLLANSDILPPVSLRINVDKNNIDSGRVVLNLLEEHNLLEKVMPNLGQIIPDNGTYDKASCLSTCDFSIETFKYYQLISNDENFMGSYPRPVANACTADKFNSSVIGADGRVYRCWSDVGLDEKCVGSLLNNVKDIAINEDIYLNYMLYDPTKDRICADCNLLPVCMGGCPYKRINDSGERCVNYKYVLENYLAIIANKLKKQQRALRV